MILSAAVTPPLNSYDKKEAIVVMEFCTLSSSSSGNCTLVMDGDTFILIDAGISTRKITCALDRFDIKPEQLSAIVLTHEHNDHIAGLKTMSKRFSVPVYASSVVGQNVTALIPETEKCMHLFDAGDEFEIGTVGVKSFVTPHDAPESVGYRFEGGGRIFAFATDMGTVTQEVYDCFKGANAAVIEANHDVDMLKRGPYPYYLKKRILSRSGHLSNTVSGKFAAAIANEGTEKIMLAHLSVHNNTPELAYEEVSGALSGIGAHIDSDV